MPNDDRIDEGDRILAELARRGGATPLAEWSEFIDAFLRSVGVPEPVGVAPLLSGLRIALAGRGVLGDLLILGLRGLAVALGRRERGEELAPGEVEMDSCLRECDRLSPAAFSSLALAIDIRLALSVLLGGEGEIWYGDAISRRCSDDAWAAERPSPSSTLANAHWGSVLQDSEVNSVFAPAL